MITESLTSPAYWDGIWQRKNIPKPLDPSSRALRDFGRRQWDRYFRHVLSLTDLLSRTSPGRLLEVGCGGSIFLPYFGKEFGFELVGIDYSEVGCAKSRAIHSAAHVPAEIQQCDMFNPPAHLRGAFDFVCSFGLAEHFRPTESAIAALSQFCRPGGYLLTTIPNLRGLPGSIQKRLNSAVYDLHVPLSAAELSACHAPCGLQIIESGPIATLNLMALNFSGPDSRIPEVVGLALAASVTRLAWGLHKLGLPEQPNELTSSHLGCLARVGSSER